MNGAEGNRLEIADRRFLHFKSRNEATSNLQSPICSPFLCLLCLLWLIPSVASATPVLVGKSVPGSSIRIINADGQVTESTADKRGAFRVEVPARFYLEIRHAGYRSVRSSGVSLATDSQDAYQVDVQL